MNSDKKNHKRYALFPGRFQPLTVRHERLIRKLIEQESYVCIAVRDTKISDDNPYSLQDRLNMLRAAFKKEIEQGIIMLCKIPDISSINMGREVGFDVNRISLPDDDTTEVSGTNFRKGKVNSQKALSKPVRNYLKKEKMDG